MQDIVILMLIWIGSQTPYDIHGSLPNIVLTEENNICKNYGIDNKGRCQAASIKGFYNKRYTIYLPNHFDIASVEDQGRLLHELVHYVQWSNGKQNSTCLGHLEVQAYELQDQWYANHNLARATDPFKMVMLEASCE